MRRRHPGVLRVQNQVLSSICARAPRYTPEGAVKYRRDGQDREWLHGRLMNVSRTGALFETASSAVPASAALEFVLRLSIPGVSAKARIRCLGRVVRCREGPEGQWAVATTIEQSELLQSVTEGNNVDD